MHIFRVITFRKGQFWFEWPVVGIVNVFNLVSNKYDHLLEILKQYLVSSMFLNSSARQAKGPTHFSVFFISNRKHTILHIIPTVQQILLILLLCSNSAFVWLVALHWSYVIFDNSISGSTSLEIFQSFLQNS